MATSGVTTWELTRDEMIDRALRILGVLPQGESANSDQVTTASMALNGIVSRFNTLGMALWKRTEANVTLVAGTSSYTVTAALKIPEVYIRVIDSSVTWKLEWKSKYDFLQLPYTTTGVPVAYCLDSTIAEGTTLQIWPIPDSTTASTYRLRVVYQEEFDGFTASANTLDMPAHWTDAVVFELASVLSPEYSIPLKDRMEIAQRAEKYLQQAKGYSDEDGSLYIQPMFRHNQV